MRTLTGKHPDIQIASFLIFLACTPFTFATDLSILLTLIKQPTSPTDEYEIKIIISNTSGLNGGPYDSPNTVIELVKFNTEEFFLQTIDVGLLEAYQTKTYIVRGFIAEEKCHRTPTIFGEVSGDETDPDPSNNENQALIICKGYGAESSSKLHGFKAALQLLLYDH